MHKFEQHIDLRRNIKTASAEESIWPTFTDIMTVVLMVFMFTMVFVIVKNSDLLQRLKVSADKEESLSKTLEESQTEHERLTKLAAFLEESLEKKKMALILVNDELKVTKNTLKNKLDYISSVEAKIGGMEIKVRDLETGLSEKVKEISNIKEAHDRNVADLSRELDKKINTLDNKILVMTRILNTRETEINRLTQSEDESKRSRAKQKSQYSALMKNYREKLDVITGLERKITGMEENLKSLKSDISEKNALVAKLREKMKITLEEFNLKYLTMTHELNAKKTENSLLSLKEGELTIALAKQRSEFSELEEKYHKLIRPARSSLQKIIVSIHYLREEQKIKILFKGVDETQYRAITMEGLHKKLDALKIKYGNTLYVKVVIPENSGLSYNEAWTFTHDILKKYDYYYQ